MKRKNMEIEEFLFVMKANPGFWPEYDNATDEQKQFVAHVNICTGTAQTFFDDDGELFGVGGIRYVGIGEPWFVTLPTKRKPFLLRTVAEIMKHIVDDKNLWRLFASSKISETFLRHLKFKKDETLYTWTRE